MGFFFSVNPDSTTIVTVISSFLPDCETWLHARCLRPPSHPWGRRAHELNKALSSQPFSFCFNTRSTGTQPMYFG